MFHFFKANPAPSKAAPSVPAAVPSPAVFNAILEAAAKAPSGHNTQPWKFDFRGNCLRIHPDFSRALPVVDPVNRELWISLGCAAENAAVAASVAGFATEIAYPVSGDGPVALTFHAAGAQGDAALALALDTRQTNRGDYDGRAVPAQTLARLSAVTTGPGTAFMVLTDRTHIERLLFWIRQGNASQLGNPLFVNELIRWTRFHRAEAEATRDGLYAAAAATGDVTRELGSRLVENQSVLRRNQYDDRTVRGSSGCILIATTSDAVPAWIETGRLYERLSLTLTAEGLTSAFINQPIEVPELRQRLDHDFNLPPYTAQILLRFGYAPQAPRSYRRPLHEMKV